MESKTKLKKIHVKTCKFKVHLNKKKEEENYLIIAIIIISFNKKQDINSIDKAEC